MFYPKDLRRSQFLEYYTQRFSFVELNSTYYRPPTPRSMEALVRHAAPGTLLSVKAHQAITHSTDAAGLEGAAAAFIEALQPVVDAGILSAVLLQFPFRFHYVAAHRRYLDLVVRSLDSLPLYVEFRNDEWHSRRTVSQMANRGIGLVGVDLPALPGLPRGLVTTTQTGVGDGEVPDTAVPGEDLRSNGPLATIPGKNGYAYVRLHGRNRDTWWTGDSRTRYLYRYTRGELGEIASRVRDIANRAERGALVAFNNHAMGNAAIDAEEFIRILGNAAPHTGVG